MADVTDSRVTSTDSKLEMTDQAGLDDLSAAFDDAFGPSDRAVKPVAAPKPPSAKAPAPPTPPKEPAAPGHHAPVELVKPAEAAPASDKDITEEPKFNLLGEPETRPRPRKKPEPSEPEPLDKTKKLAVKETEEEAEPVIKDDDPDPEVDAIRAKANAHPNVKEGIQRLKDIAKNRRTEIRTLAAKTKELENQLSTIRTKGIPPEIEKELTQLRATSNRFDLLNDEAFKAKYEEPILQHGNKLVDYIVKISNDEPLVVKWAEETRKFGFQNVSRDYWDKEILPNIASDTDRSIAATLAGQLVMATDERNRVVSDFVSNPDKIGEYRQQQQLEHWTNFQKTAQEEADRIVKQIGPWAQLKDLEAAKSDEERGQFEEHNKRTEGYKTIFEKTMGDLISNDPRKFVRIATQAVYGMELSRQIGELQADYDDLRAEYQQLKTQHEKVARVRSVQAKGGSHVVDGQHKQQDGIHTGDARTALKNFFSGEQGGS